MTPPRPLLLDGLTPSELHARHRQMSPGPFQDAVAGMFFRDVSAHTTAGFFKIGLREVSAMVHWVAETNIRRSLK